MKPEHEAIPPTDAAYDIPHLFNVFGPAIDHIDEAIRSHGGNPMRCELYMEDPGPDAIRCQVMTDGIHVCFLHVVWLNSARGQVVSHGDVKPWETEGWPAS